MSPPDVSVVIPSWNGSELLRAHLPSVLKAVGAAASGEVVVSDDGSEDRSAEMLRSEFPAVRVVERGSNDGFSHAANDGVAAASGRIVVLLNNDMEVRASALAHLVTVLDIRPEVFAAVPSIVRVATGEEEGLTRLQFRRGVVSSSIDGGEGGRERDPAYACGGAMAFRREEFLKLGGFDTLFSPFYWEDVDLSYRARKRGRSIAHVPAARVEHDHGRTIRARFDRATVSRIYERNRLLFTWKNLTDPPLWRRHLIFLPPKVVWDLVAHPAFVHGLSKSLALRRDLLPKRRLEQREGTIRDRELLS